MNAVKTVTNVIKPAIMQSEHTPVAVILVIISIRMKSLAVVCAAEIFHLELNYCVIRDQMLMSVLKKSMNVMNIVITQLAAISATVLDLAIDFTVMALHVKVQHKINTCICWADTQFQNSVCTIFL